MGHGGVRQRDHDVHQPDLPARRRVPVRTRAWDDLPRTLSAGALLGRSGQALAPRRKIRPTTRSQLPSPREAVLLDQLAAALGGTGFDLLSAVTSGIASTTTAAGRRAGRARPPARPGDSAAAMALVDEDAGDPPARTRRRVLRVLTMVLEPEFLRTAVLAPALREVVLVEDQCGMRAARPDQLLLQSAGIADAALVLGVMGDAPAPSVDPVAALDLLGKSSPWTRGPRPGQAAVPRSRPGHCA